MQQIVRTKWHRIIPLIDAGEVHLTAPPVVQYPRWKGMAPPWEDLGGNPEKLKTLVHACDDLPRFVIDSELVSLIKDQDYQRSLLDMKRAGVLRLPYPELVVEYSAGSDPFGKKQHHNMIVLRESTKNDDSDFPFLAAVFRVHKDDGGEYLVVGPGFTAIDVQDNNGDPWLRISGYAAEYIDGPAEKVNDFVQACYQKDAGCVWYALAGVLLLMATGGIKREVIDVGKLNSKRVAAGKTSIPKHTYIRIGHVYRIDHEGDEAADEYNPRRSPRPHWRRGHLKMVHYGKGHVGVRQVYIPPRLVAYRDLAAVEPPANRDYVVTK